MKILIAGSVVGNEGYEEEMLVKALEKELKKQHTVDSFLLPFSRDFLSLPDQILAYQLLDTSDCDMLITVGYPACMLEHKNKIIYLFDIAPHFWEYWDSEYGVLCNNQYLKIRDTVHKVDMKILANARKVVCNSKILSEDLTARIGIHPTVIYPPVLEFEKGVENIGGEYILLETSLLPYQRPELLIEVAKNIQEYRFKVFVPNADEVYIETLGKWIDQKGLSGKIEIILDKAGTKDYKNASGYIVPDFTMRRISNGVIKAASMGLPVIYTKDCGAPGEILANYSNSISIDSGKFNSINDDMIDRFTKNKKYLFKANDSKAFAERLIAL